MNAASQDLVRHFEILRQKLEHPTDYEQALYYFLEEFAGDIKFLKQSEPDEVPYLLAALTQVARRTLGYATTLEGARVLRLPGFGFVHGNAASAGRAVLFFYFEEADTGVMALIPGLRGGAQIARFRLKEQLPDPSQN
jgi:hypothetical protein